jgi:hypothetical protein
MHLSRKTSGGGMSSGARSWRRDEILGRALLALFVLGIAVSLLLVSGALAFTIALLLAALLSVGLSSGARRARQAKMQRLSLGEEITVPAQLWVGQSAEVSAARPSVPSTIDPSRTSPRGWYAGGRLALGPSRLEWSPGGRRSRKHRGPVSIPWKELDNLELTAASPGIARGARLWASTNTGTTLLMIVGDRASVSKAITLWWSGPDNSAG